MSRRTGFTLIELLVVIAIIAILAAILFPVFARARAKAQQADCLSNVKQLTLSTLMYCTDYDDHYPWAWSSIFGSPGPSQVEWWSAEVYPYVKNAQIYECPAGSTPTPTLIPGTGWGVGPYLGPEDYRENPCLGQGGMGPGCGTGQPQPPLMQAAVLRPAEMLCVIACQPGYGPGYAANPDAAQPQYTGGDPTLQSSYSPSYYYPGIETVHNQGGNVGYCDGHAKWLSQQLLYAWDANDLRMWNNVP